MKATPRQRVIHLGNCALICDRLARRRLPSDSAAVARCGRRRALTAGAMQERRWVSGEPRMIVLGPVVDKEVVGEQEV